MCLPSRGLVPKSSSRSWLEVIVSLANMFFRMMAVAGSRLSKYVPLPSFRIASKGAPVRPMAGIRSTTDAWVPPFPMAVVQSEQSHSSAEAVMG